MKENPENNVMAEKRSGSRRIVDRFYSVEFLSKDHFIYQFKLRDISSKGLCIIVNESSAVLKQLKVGDTLAMTFNPPRAEGPPESLKTEIVHITKNAEEPFTGHVLIGLLIIERKNIGAG
jgi:hypothetical protein